MDEPIIIVDYDPQWPVRYEGDAHEYGELKKSLAAQHSTDREGYTDAKKTFVEAILVKAALEDA